MRRFDMLRWMWLLSVVPLLIGSVSFFWWFYARYWYAHDARIESIALLAIFTFYVFALLVVVMSIVRWVRGTSPWYSPVGPLTVLLFTFCIIDLYDTTYQGLRERVFLRIDAKGSGATELLLWSAHFEASRRMDLEEKEHVFCYTPTFTYDWSTKNSSGASFTMDTVYVDIHRGSDVETRILPMLYRGECRTIAVQELMDLPVVSSRPDRDIMAD